MKRKIIKIDEEKCTGCGQCIPDCPEGALQVIDGKVRLVSDLFCDGLGACMGSCPEGAITTEEREAEPYDERKVMENIIPKGENTVKAHLKHLEEHGEEGYLKEARDVLKEKGLYVDEKTVAPLPCGCPGTSAAVIKGRTKKEELPCCESPSKLGHWPVQLHLVSPGAAYFRGMDVILAADCTAFACGDFHRRFLRGKSIAVACPKLDSGRDEYIEKIRSLADEAGINTLNVIIMEVPCCRGLVSIAQEGLKKAERKVPLKLTVVGINGDILSEQWL
ncbi:MAG TPA: 4Fe-4S binding protein [bacterium]|nr:4Fe-4S binding protein [bacterium]